MSELLIDQVKKKLRQLYLRDMAEYLDKALEKAQKNQLGVLEFLNDITDRQIKARNRRSLERRLKIADFPRNMTFDNFDFNFQPSLNVEYLKDLMALSFVADRKPLLIFGKTGAGKTHIAAALGMLACEANFKVRFYTLQKLLAILYTSLADDTTDEVIAGLGRFDLLIMDNAGNVRSKPEYPSLLLDLVSSCMGNTALIVTSAISFEEWSVLLGNPPVTHAIIDRLMHQAELINIRKALSYRTQGPGAPKLPDPES
jgi:DNA replication protein DnaC